jgi:hypothetical protein
MRNDRTLTRKEAKKQIRADSQNNLSSNYRKVLIMLPEHLVRLKGLIIRISSKSLMNKDSHNRLDLLYETEQDAALTPEIVCEDS